RHWLMYILVLRMKHKNKNLVVLVERTLHIFNYLMWFTLAYLMKGTRMRKFKVIIGAKRYFQERIKDIDKAKSFLDLVKLSDACRERGFLLKEEQKADLLVLKNDNYLALSEPANDRLGDL